MKSSVADHLGGDRWRAETIGEVDRTKPHSGRYAGERGHHGPAFEDGALAPQDQVVGYPQRVVAKLLGLLHGALKLVEVDALEQRRARMCAAGTGEYGSAEPKSAS